MVHVQIMVSGPERPSPGSMVTVEVRDAALQDAPSKLLGSAEVRVTSTSSTIGTVDVPISSRGEYPVVSVHVDMDGDHKVSSGDWITMQSYPVPTGDNPTVEAVVRRVP